MRGGQIAQITRDQSYAQLLIDAGGMTAERAQEGGLRNVILQAMGLRPEVSVALGKLDLRHLDCLLVCSDGLSNKMTPAELATILLGSPRLDVGCARLVEVAKKRGSEDNITAIVAGVSGDLPPLAPRESIAQTFSVIQEFRPPR